MAEKASRGDGLREDNANGNENGAAARGERNGNLGATAIVGRNSRTPTAI